ncbi:MAG: redoxin family protein [Planctomycetota bacterium]
MLRTTSRIQCRTPMALIAAAAFAAATPAMAGPGDHDHDHPHDHAHAHDHNGNHVHPPEITDYIPDYELPKLWFGSEAPELRIAEFVKGEPVTSFEPGRVYVVEFWATWCGPCIRAFPHLSELQEAHADDMTIIGVNIWDTERGEDHATRTQRVKDFVKAQGDRMAYTVAIEEGEAMAESWMKKAGRGGIPSAFIVDQAGDIAWMGHPGGMDEPLKAIMAGEYDSAESAKKAAENHKFSAWQDVAMNKIVKNEDDAYEVVGKLIPTVFADHPMVLNQIAWTILTHERVEQRDPKTAYAAAHLACEKTDWKDPAVLDTFALAAFETGAVEEAVKMQKKAIGLLPGTPWENAKGDFEKALKKYEAKLAEG